MQNDVQVAEQQVDKKPNWLIINLIILKNNESAMLWIMAGLHIFWLISIGFLGASSDWGRLIGISIYSLAAVIVVAVFTHRIDPGWMEKFRSLFKDEKRVLLLLLFTCVFIGVIYAIFQRVWVYDEEENFRIASVFATQGFGEFISIYSHSQYFANQHPPLVALIYGSVMKFLGIDLLIARLVSLVFCIGIVWLTYLCGRELFDGQTGLLSAAILMTFPLIMRLGTVAMLDIPVTFFFLVSFYLFLSLSKKPSFWKALFWGLTIMACFMSRYSGIFVIPVLVVCASLSAKYRKTIPYLIVAFVITGILILGWLYHIHGLDLSVPGISRYLPIGLNPDSTHIKKVVPGWILRSEEHQVWRWALNSLVTRLPSGIGVYNLPLIALGALLVMVTRKLPGIMLIMWIITVAILLLFTLPDHRYFMPTFPAMALLAGAWLRDRGRVSMQILILAYLLLFGTLYLFVDWQREAQLFTP